MKEKLKFDAQRVFKAEDDKEISAIAQKRGIKFPSSHLGFFKTVYAKIEEPNLNKIRLAREAVEKALPGLIGSQVNFSHLQKGFIMGHILDAWINAEDEIEVVYSFYKAIYAEEYEDSLELLDQGKLSVSFELLSDRSSQEHLADGTTRLHDIDFIGMGHLMDVPPAYPKAKVYEFAKRCKERLANVDRKELVCASEIEKACDEVIKENAQDSEEVEVMSEVFLITTSDDSHFHVARVDMDGNGQTISGHGEGKHEQPHMIRNWQIQVAESTISDEPHAHQILDHLLAEVKKYFQEKSYTKDKEILETSKKKKMEERTLTEEQIKQVEAVRAELGDIVKDVTDKDLLDEAKVAEYREKKKASEESEESKESEETKEEASDLEKAQARVKELEDEVEKLKSTLESKDSEIEAVRENAEKVATLKIELKDNPYTKEFSDEDYLDEAKVEKARIKKENDDLKAKVKALEESEKDEKEASEDKEDKEEVDASEEDKDLETGKVSEDEDQPISKTINSFFASDKK